MKPVTLKEGIVLTNTDYKEQAVLVTVLTNEGLENFIIKGAKKISSGTRLLSNVLTKISFSCTQTEGLNTITEGICLDSFVTIKNNINKMAVVYPIIEKILTFANQVTDNKVFYSFVVSVLDMLSTNIIEEVVLALFEIKLTFLIGIGPEVKRCLKCGRLIENGVFSVYNGGCFCENCKNGVSFELDELETKVFILLYLVKIKMVDKNFEIVVKDDVKKILSIVDLYYQKHLDFTSKAKKVMRSITG